MRQPHAPRPTLEPLLLTPPRLAGSLVYMRRGQRQECPLWWAVAHVFNHQTHHRGQVTALLTQQGCDPGVTDLFAMLLEEAASGSVREDTAAQQPR